MIAPPKIFAAAAVRPKNTLVRIGFIRAADHISRQSNSPQRHRVTEMIRSDFFSVSLWYRDLSRVADVHDVAILHDVVLAFEAQRAFRAGVGFRASFQQLVPANGFGADEMLFQVGVNCARGLLGAGVGRNLPGAAFVLAGGEKRNQAKQLVSRADEADQAALFETVAGKKFGGIGVAAYVQLRLDFAAYRC